MPIPGITLLELPEEVLTHIVRYAPDDSIPRLFLVCRKLNRISSSPLELRERCLRLRFWDERHGIADKRANPYPADVGWKSLFLYRHQVDRETTALLNKIIDSQTNHITHFNEIADFGYDAKDCLSRHAGVSDWEVGDPLARRWHASTAIRYIHRRRALKIMKRIVSHSDVSLETALASLELFVMNIVAPDVEDIVSDLDKLAIRFRQETPEFPELSVQKQAIALIHWMWKQGFTSCPADRYRALKNAFIGMTLRSVRSAIPLTLVTIFCAISKRIGLSSSAVGFPGHVYARVDDPSTGQYWFYNIFPNGSEVSLEDPQMDEAHALLPPPGNPPSTPTILHVVRMSQNILSTLRLSHIERLQNDHGYPRVCESSACYAALTALVVLRPEFVSHNIVLHLIQSIPSEFPMDVRFLEEEVLPKVEGAVDRTQLANVCNALRAVDSTPRNVMRRPKDGSDVVKYKVGTVFRHKKREYQAAIFGWMSACVPVEDEELIEQINVESLPKGRSHPFYNAIVEDGSVRSVAEENVVPIAKPGPSLSKLAGKYFRRFDEATGRFVSNVKEEYPDD